MRRIALYANRKHFTIVLSKEERIALDTKVRQYTSPHCDVIRAKIILPAAEGLSNGKQRT